MGFGGFGARAVWFERCAMRFQENTPIYVQIANDIKEHIVAGKLCEGEKLSSIREFSTGYEVTGLTVQRALGLLEQEGVVQTRKGVGSFVNSGMRDMLRDRMMDDLVRGFVARASNMGVSGVEIMVRVKDGLKFRDTQS